jgi:3-methyladenine DNA glycosylase AlkD
MQAYLKSAMPFLGVPAPVRRRALRDCLRSHTLADRKTYEGTVRQLWDGATHREERYAALWLAERPRHRSWRDSASLPLYDHLVVTGAWWDYVDEIAAKLLGPVLRAQPDQVAPVMRSWARADDLWRRRAAILCQLRAKADTDVELLVDCLDPSLQRSEFFLRKAVGWALRDYAYTDPSWVRAYLASHRDQMTPLSVREASRHLG